MGKSARHDQTSGSVHAADSDCLRYGRSTFVLGPCSIEPTPVRSAEPRPAATWAGPAVESLYRYTLGVERTPLGQGNPGSAGDPERAPSPRACRPGATQRPRTRLGSGSAPPTPCGRPRRNHRPPRRPPVIGPGRLALRDDRRTW